MNNTNSNYNTYNFSEHNFQLLSMSVPKPINNKSGFKSAITSSVYLIKFLVETKEFFTRMNTLNLKRFIIVIVSKDMKYKLHKIQEVIDDKTFTMTIFHLNTSEFFSLKSFNFFFNQEKNRNYEIIFAFKGQS